MELGLHGKSSALLEIKLLEPRHGLGSRIGGFRCLPFGMSASVLLCEHPALDVVSRVTLGRDQRVAAGGRRKPDQHAVGQLQRECGADPKQPGRHGVGGSREPAGSWRRGKRRDPVNARAVVDHQ